MLQDEVVLLLRRQSKGFQRAANPLKGVRKQRQRVTLLPCYSLFTIFIYFKNFLFYMYH